MGGEDEEPEASTKGPRLLYSDLFAFGRRSLVWLRLFRLPAGKVIALAFNPADSEGAGPVNDAEALLAALRTTFPTLGAPRLMVRFAEDPRGEGWTEVRETDGTLAFERLAATTLEALLGADLTDPPYPTLVGIAGKGHPLLALLPLPEEPRNPLEELAVIAVVDLPWPHAPYRCRWKERFDRVRELYPEDSDREPVVGAHWFLTLSDEDLAACPRHHADWRRIADIAVAVLGGLGDEDQLDDVSAAIADRLDDPAEVAWCVSLFADPIVVHAGVDSVTDGQHRACALRASGAPLCVVAVADGALGESAPSDPRRRAAADVASFWAQRAAR